MPQSYGNNSQRRGRWRGDGWQKVQKKGQSNKQPASKTWGAPHNAGSGGHTSYAAAAASASANAKQQQWTAAEWADWTAGGWKAGLANNQPVSGATSTPAPRDEQRDIATAGIRQ